MKFIEALKKVFVKKVPNTSEAGELDVVDWAKIIRDLLVGCALASLAFVVQYLQHVDLSGVWAWWPTVVPVALAGLRWLIQLLQGKKE